MKAAGGVGGRHGERVRAGAAPTGQTCVSALYCHRQIRSPCEVCHMRFRSRTAKCQGPSGAIRKWASLAHYFLGTMLLPPLCTTRTRGMPLRCCSQRTHPPVLGGQQTADLCLTLARLQCGAKILRRCACKVLHTAPTAVLNTAGCPQAGARGRLRQRKCSHIWRTAHRIWK